MKRIISLALIITLISSVFVFSAHAYTASDWAVSELKKAEALGIIPESLLNADLTKGINRAEFAAVTVKLYEYLSGEEAFIKQRPFTDTQDEYVLKAYALGITTGTSNTTFSPNDLLDREQAATMLARVYKLYTMKGWSIKKDANFPLKYENTNKFADDSKISDWAKDSVYFMAANGVINGIGDNKFAPTNITEAEKKSGYANATREQALLIATRMTNMDMESYKYVVASIGGSLTELGNEWQYAVKAELEKQMPGKEVVLKNAGKCGTSSEYGSIRFKDDVLSVKPDLVFIEFAVNDWKATEIRSKVYMESMLRQCMEAEKVPNVVFLYAPRACEPSAEEQTYANENIRWKEEIAQAYGINSVNVFDYMQRDCAKEHGLSYDSYLSRYYTKVDGVYDIHGGYVKYGEAIIEEIQAGLDKFLTKPVANGYVCDKKTVDYKYNQIYANDPRLSYNGFTKYTETNSLETSVTPMTISYKNYKYPFFPQGVLQTISSASVEFTTTAEAICLAQISSTSGANAIVTVDGKPAGNITCNSINQGLTFPTSWVSLPNDGKEHKVIIYTDSSLEGSNNVFRFGSVIERFEN